jgi:hypothetical protein
VSDLQTTRAKEGEDKMAGNDSHIWAQRKAQDSIIVVHNPYLPTERRAVASKILVITELRVSKFK